MSQRKSNDNKMQDTLRVLSLIVLKVHITKQIAKQLEMIQFFVKNQIKLIVIEIKQHKSLFRLMSPQILSYSVYTCFKQVSERSRKYMPKRRMNIRRKSISISQSIPNTLIITYKITNENEPPMQKPAALQSLKLVIYSHSSSESKLNKLLSPQFTPINTTKTARNISTNIGTGLLFGCEQSFMYSYCFPVEILNQTIEYVGFPIMAQS